MSLASQLGYAENDRLLIINGDDFGLSPSVNEGIQQLLREEVITSSSIMMPCAFARAAAVWSAANPKYDVGIHFTFTSEWDLYKWGPVTRHADVTSLVTDEGYFHSNTQAFEKAASPSQVLLELHRQVELSLTLGMKPTHADSHMSCLYGLNTGENFLLETLDLCAHYGLPFRTPRYVNERQQEIVTLDRTSQINAISKLADDKGVIIPDYVIGLPYEQVEGETTTVFLHKLMDYLTLLNNGVSELIIHPSQPSYELHYFHKHADKRVIEWEALRQPEFRAFLKEQDIKLICWSELQQLQRKQSNKAYPY